MTFARNMMNNSSGFGGFASAFANEPVYNSNGFDENGLTETFSDGSGAPTNAISFDLDQIALLPATDRQQLTATLHRLKAAVDEHVGDAKTKQLAELEPLQDSLIREARRAKAAWERHNHKLAESSIGFQNALEQEKKVRRELAFFTDQFKEKDQRLMLSEEKAAYKDAIKRGQTVLAAAVKHANDLQDAHNQLVAELQALAVINNAAADAAVSNGAAIERLKQ